MAIIASMTVDRWSEGRRTEVAVDVSAGGFEDESCVGSVGDAPLDEDEALRLARLLGSLADPVRLRLLSILLERGAACSCDLEAPLGRSQSTISHHTKVLAEAGVVVAERRGRWTWWSISPDCDDIVRRALGASGGLA